MRIHIHDFSGHPFQVQLSRALAHRGHEVRHTFCGEYVTGHGRLSVEPGDAPTFSAGSIETGLPFEKYNVAARLRFELAYGKALPSDLRDDRRPDVIMICNVPLLAMSRASRYLRKRVPTVFWHQDVYSLAMTDELTRSLPKVLAAPVGRMVQGAEREILRASSAVVAIADSFEEQYRAWGLSLPDVSIIPNWAPIDEITPGPRENAWSTNWSGDHDVRLLYAGTIGRKHKPRLLVDLLRAVREHGVSAGLTVVSEGQGADEVAASAGGDPAVTVLPFQPVQVLPDVLASADVLVALLEPEASRFSVPSKVASYLAAGRPVVLLGPTDNPAAEDLRKAGGFVALPTQAGVAEAAAWIAEITADAERSADIGARARTFAEERYDIDRIVPRFEDVLERSLRRWRHAWR